MAFMQAPSSGGDFNTFIKYDARSGRWHTKPDGGGDLYEVTNVTAVMDIENIRTGWFQFFEGAAPLKEFDPSLSEAAPKPNAEARRGFEVMMYSEKNIGGLREFTSTAGVVIDAMNALHDEWMVNRDTNPGKLPVVKCQGVTAVKTSKSTNYSPALHIVSWTDRPVALAGDAPKAPPAASAPAATSAQHLSPPAAKAPEPVTADSDTDF